MGADAIDFGDDSRIDSNSGRISLGGARHFLIDADTLGNMRRELMDNLGWNAARGILERAGYQHGRHNATRLREQQGWTSEEQQLCTGLQLHTIEGLAEVRIDHADVSRDPLRFQLSGEWRGSCEAEQHLKHYETGDRTACWMLEGYATGYATEFFGREVVCLETQCVAKGDPACRFEIRMAADWGEAAYLVQDFLTSVRFSKKFDHCIRCINEMGCDLEQTSLDAIITTDARGVITSCGQGASDLLDLRPGDAVGKKVSLFYAGGAAESERIMRRLRKDGRIRHYLTEIISPSRRKTPIELAASVIRNGVGEIVGTIGVAHNLTEIRRLEDELAAKNRFMANILRDSADAIMTMDPNDVVTSWNKGAETIFGYHAEEAVGRPVSFLLTPELKEEQELAKLARRFRSQGAVRSYQTERVTKDGRRIQVIFTRTAIRDDNGNVVGSSTVLKDVTLSRNLEKQLANAEHLATLGELSAGLAHEIKNPLAGIKGAIDVIRDSLSPSDLHREVLGDVLHEVNRIDKIVKDLLNYAKPKPPSLSTISLPEMAQRIAAMARKSSKSEAHSIELIQLTAIPEFTGDEMQLEQVLMNLLLNAQKAAPNGGHIRISLAYDEEEACIRMEVQDDGPGIAEEVKPRIFQPFFTTRTDGTGLGLATCLKNVQYHGGSIEVQSEAGRGTTFVVSIPMLCHI